MRRLAICLAATVAIFAACSTSALADPPGGWLGVDFWPVALVQGGRLGFRINKIIEGSPAADAGLQKGDVVVALDGVSFATVPAMGDALNAKGPGAIVSLDVMRGDAARVVTAKLASFDVAKNIFKKQAEAGNVWAMLGLGQMLMMGPGGVAKDYVEARHWLMMAADRGSGPAMHLLGDMTKLGLGGKVDFEAADRWYQRAAVVRQRESLGDFPRTNPLSPPQETAWPRGLAEALGEQIRACWKPTKGWPAVTVRFKLAQDGALSGEPEIPLHKAEAGDAETAAVGAITKCQPFRLPADQYEAWKSVVWTFDPAIMD